MADTAEIHLSLANIWEYLRARIVDSDIGPYPHENIVIGGCVLQRKPGAPIEIARQDALAAGDAWHALCQGHSGALNDPRLGRVLEALGYAMGRRSSLEIKQATQFGAWLANRVTGWSEGQVTEEDLYALDCIARQANSFGSSVEAVLTDLRGNVEYSDLVDPIFKGATL